MVNKVVTRYWQIGATKIEDPLSALPFEQSFQMLAKTNPQVRHTQMFSGDGIAQEDGSILYVIPLIPAKTNG
ncbi:hypothetical protein [Vibrio sp. 1180_3]|uniref:hypothetical protein n=1 Tax=Vibrio sp. 1180_3 TaxID=2528832 RepID=UPI002406C7C4|nr:hypothetical protein [Vibrio sp. 1180_3]MDF9399073.1 hypothetical protein [Vibrio sp. 1180_3]